MQLLDHIQNQLEQTYQITSQANAADFLIDINQVRELLPAHQNTSMAKELLLVNQNPEEDTVEIALFLDANLQSNLKNNNPLQNLNKHNLSDYCTLIEGVSHFVYYLHKASLQRPITQLEMELQAEIDKYVILALASREALPDHYDMIEILFEDYALMNHLNAEQYERYEMANRLARKFCSHLNQHILSGNHQTALAEIRSIYVLGQEEKIRRINL